ncbi:MAG TPA: Rrf2 family transcriptional regulator [Chloroflexota bacterium]|jgi:Rrf2 family protein|nr:Rrf2 family transcriptional regulator [Chloroflexota bacterium]
MKVSTRVHYGLRAMTELARSYRSERLLSISEIARSEDLPLAYLEQLVGELRRAGLVEGTRGVRGGYRLSRGPEAITVGDVYRILEGEVAPVDCTAEDYLPGACTRETVCMSRSIWSRVQAAILGVLDSTTLDDLLVSDALQHAAGQFIALDAVPVTHPRKGEFAHA